MKIYGRNDMTWDGNKLRLGNRGRILASIEPDKDWLGMYRVRTPDGKLTDMVNLTRAKDAAIALAAQALNSQRAA